MNNDLNVIFLGSFLYPQGYAATKRKQQFIEYLLNKGVKVRVLITLKWARNHEMNPPEGNYNGVTYELLGVAVKKNVLFPLTFLHFIFRAGIKIFQYKMKNQKNIVVSFGLNFNTIFPILFAYFVGYKIVFDIVEDFNTITYSNNILKKLEKWVSITLLNSIKFRIASGISVISTYINLQINKKNYQGCTTFIPISASNLNYEIPKIHLNSNYFKLLYSGTYGEKEGLETLIEAFKLVLVTNPSTKLILTGNCPHHIFSLLIKKLGSLDNVLLTGRLSEYDYYSELANCDIMLMTRNDSKFSNAGFPYKLGEYLATGNPVVCTNVSDVSLYLNNKESALIVRPDDPYSLFQAITELMENWDLAKHIGENGRNICQVYFNPKINSKKFYDLLKRI
ncbi:MAG: glycosyltransferase [Bacteroidales bacterium]